MHQNSLLVDEEYLTIGGHMEKSLREKIIRYEYIDFARLLLKDMLARTDDNWMKIVCKGGLTYFTPVADRKKWSRKLLIHMFNLLILNVYILNKLYGCEKLTHDEYRDKIVKYLLAEGLKNYKIPLLPVISRKIGKWHKGKHDKK